MRLGAALMIVAAASAACRGKPGADDPNTLVVISPHDETIRDEFTIAFERSEREAGRASRVRWQPARGTGNIMRFLENEFASARSGRPVGVDVFFGGGVPAFEAARKAGYLEPIAVDPALVESVPASWGGLPLRAQDGSWYGATVNGFGIFFHRKGHAARGWDEPEAWADLANPRYAGLIEMADATESGSAQAAYEMVLEQHGWDEGWPLLHRMAANSASFPRSSSDVVRDVSTGQVLAGMSIDFYAYTQIAETGKDVVGFSVPEGGTAWTPDPIAVIRGTSRKGLAARFVAFVLSEKGQGLWALPVGALGGPTKKALFRPPILPSLYDGKEPLLVEVDPYAVPPHPADFVTNHAEEGKQNAESCSMCHGGEGQVIKGGGPAFCNNCHHSAADPNRSWIDQHMEKVDETGAQACFECHKPTYCAECHVRGAK